MKTQVLSLPLWLAAGLLFLSGCASRITNVPTRTYAYEQQDSSALKEKSIHLDSQRILLIAQTEDATITQTDSLYSTLLNVKSSGVKMQGIRQSTTGMETASITGTVHNQFQNLLHQKIVQKLQNTTDVFVLQNSSGEISRNLLDSITQKFDIDLIINANGITYQVEEEITDGGQPSDLYKLSHVALSHYTHSGSSKSIRVWYESEWELLWLDKSTKKVQKEQRIVQTGMHWDRANYNKGVTLMEEILACALKAADDFTALFK